MAVDNRSCLEVCCYNSESLTFFVFEICILRRIYVFSVRYSVFVEGEEKNFTEELLKCFMILRHLLKDAKTKSETENIRILEQIIERFRFFLEKKKIKKQRFEINASRVRENNCLENNFFHFQRNKVEFFLLASILVCSQKKYVLVCKVGCFIGEN